MLLEYYQLESLPKSLLIKILRINVRKERGCKVGRDNSLEIHL